MDREQAAEIHRHLLAAAKWRKTARIVGNVSEHYGKLGIGLDPAIAAACLMKMIDSNLVEAAGDLRMWLSARSG
jgi:hypothetical protein